MKSKINMIILILISLFYLIFKFYWYKNIFENIFTYKRDKQFSAVNNVLPYYKN